MGWLLTLWLSLPQVASDVEVRMCFSRSSYCSFAKDKFTENPIRHGRAGGPQSEAIVRSIDCRKLSKDEAHLVPEHMR